MKHAMASAPLPSWRASPETIAAAGPSGRIPAAPASAPPKGLLSRFSLRHAWRPLGRLMLTLSALCVLAGCSAGLKLAYNHLDTLVALELDDFVKLDARQQRAFDAEFMSLWRWHRQTQLPLYGKDLRAMAERLASGSPTADQYRSFLAQVDQHGEVATDRVLAMLQPLLPLLQDRQAESVIAKLRRDIDREEDKHANETDAERRQRYLDTVADRMKRWLGTLNPEQRQAVERSWERGVPLLRSPAQRRQAQLDEVQAFADVLAKRRDGDFAERLGALWHAEPAPGEAASTANARELTIDLLVHMDGAQRKRLQRKLLDLAEDCDALVASASEVTPAP